MCKNSGDYTLCILKNGMAYSIEQGQGTTHEITAYEVYSLTVGNSQPLLFPGFQKPVVFRLLN